MSVKPEHIITRGDREFILYAGLLAAAHAAGLAKLEVKILQFPSEENGRRAICQATACAIGADEVMRIFTDIGDADPKNVGPGMEHCFIRMSATRAKARALRDLTNIDLATVEEMAIDEPPRPRRSARPPLPVRSSSSVPASVVRPTPDETQLAAAGELLATDNQIDAIRKLCANHSLADPDKLVGMTRVDAGKCIMRLSRLPKT